MRFHTQRRPGSSFPWQNVFPSQCIERHTEELYDVQGNTSMRTPQALSRGETDEASSRSYFAQLSILRPLSIDHVADGTRVFLLRTAIRQSRTLSHSLSPEESPRAHRPHSHLSSSNPKNRSKMAVRRPPFSASSCYQLSIRRPSIPVVKYPEVRLESHLPEPSSRTFFLALPSETNFPTVNRQYQR